MVESISHVFVERRVEELCSVFDNKILFRPDTLTEVSKELDALRVQIKSPDSKDQLVRLYGRVDSLCLNNQIDQVVDASLALSEKKETYPPKVLAKKVRELQKKLGHIWIDFSLSISNRRFVRLAAKVLNDLEVFPSSKTEDVLNLANVSNLIQDQEMLPESKLRSSHVDSEGWESAELAFDLCEIAHLFYQNKFNEGMKKLHQLSPSEKSQLEHHCLTLDTEFPQFFLVDDVTVYRENLIRFIQALIGFANEVAQGESLEFYPSAAEIDMMFSEVEALNQEELQETQT